MLEVGMTVMVVSTTDDQKTQWIGASGLIVDEDVDGEFYGVLFPAGGDIPVYFWGEELEVVKQEPAAYYNELKKRYPFDEDTAFSNPEEE